MSIPYLRDPYFIVVVAGKSRAISSGRIKGVRVGINSLERPVNWVEAGTSTRSGFGCRFLRRDC
jgi:hypothetical protein